MWPNLANMVVVDQYIRKFCRYLNYKFFTDQEFHYSNACKELNYHAEENREILNLFTKLLILQLTVLTCCLKSFNMFRLVKLAPYLPFINSFIEPTTLLSFLEHSDCVMSCAMLIFSDLMNHM